MVTDVAEGESAVDVMGVPATGPAGRALEVATAFYPPPLLNHCLRSYLWGVHWATTHGVTFDAELLYVASLLHDLGMTRSFDSHHIAFEQAGGDVAWVFLAGVGWPVERRDRARKVVANHLREDADPETDSEAHLLQVAVTFDVTGHRADAFPGSLRSQVLSRYPRLEFAREFLALCTAQAERKPGSAMAGLIRGGIGHRIAGNPLDR